jgi:hypothetical protein
MSATENLTQLHNNPRSSVELDPTKLICCQRDRILINGIFWLCAT